MTEVDYIRNPTQRTPCVLVLDASHSMQAMGPSGKTSIAALTGLSFIHDGGNTTGTVSLYGIRNS